jgi:hypothetical protein
MGAGSGPLVTLPAQKRGHLGLDRTLQKQLRTQPGHLLNRTRQILATGEHTIDLRVQLSRQYPLRNEA